MNAVSLSWLPNALTVSRCLLAGVVLWSAFTATGQFAGAVEASEWSRRATLEQLWSQMALLAFIAGALTDLGDGVLARALKAQSRFGVWLDPIADKLLVAAALTGLCLTIGGWAVIAPAAAIIARDLGMTLYRATPEGRAAVAVSPLAKWKTALEMLAIAGLMLPAALAPRRTDETPAAADSLVALAPFGFLALLWIAAALSLWTAASYIAAARAGRR